MYKRILVAVDLNEESGWRLPLVAAAEQARKSGSEQLVALTVIREIEALVYAQVADHLAVRVGVTKASRGTRPARPPPASCLARSATR
ncbi:MAG: hypothetical protein J2P48_08865 [Alphaproteobacteria bacterium]|nr:hypothetical protein [Alphaproteobacteria bacterium]